MKIIVQKKKIIKKKKLWLLSIISRYVSREKYRDILMHQWIVPPLITSPWHTTQIQIEKKKIKKKRKKGKNPKTSISLHQAKHNYYIIHIIFCISVLHVRVEGATLSHRHNIFVLRILSTAQRCKDPVQGLNLITPHCINLIKLTIFINQSVRAIVNSVCRARCVKSFIYGPHQ